MEPALRPSEVRVLGTLIEKAMSTPEYYPLSQNALRNGCNQKNNRAPVTDYDEQTISDALMTLARKQLAAVLHDGRVEKYRHRFSELYAVTPKELALLCELFLRGPQTAGELHTRARRLVQFDSLDEVSRVLEGLAHSVAGEMVRRLGRQPGQKDSRYMHLFCPDLLKDAEGGGSGTASATEAHHSEHGANHAVLLKHTDDERLNLLVEEMASLKRDIAILNERLEGLSRQLTEHRH